MSLGRKDSGGGRQTAKKSQQKGGVSHRTPNLKNNIIREATVQKKGLQQGGGGSWERSLAARAGGGVNWKPISAASGSSRGVKKYSKKNAEKILGVKRENFPNGSSLSHENRKGS